jgi:hypothetical protein
VSLPRIARRALALALVVLIAVPLGTLSACFSDPDASGAPDATTSEIQRASTHADDELGAAWGGSGPGYDVWVKSLLQFAATTGYAFKALPRSANLESPGDSGMIVVVFRDGAGRPRHAAWYVREWAQQGYPTAMGIRPFEAMQVWHTNNGPQIPMTSPADVQWWNTYLTWIMEDFSVRIQTAGITFKRPQGCLDSTAVACFVGVGEWVSGDTYHNVSVTAPWPYDADANLTYSHSSRHVDTSHGWLDIIGRIFTGLVTAAIGAAIGELIFVGSDVAATTFGAAFGAFTNGLIHGDDLESALLDGLMAGAFAFVGASLVDAFGDPTALVGVSGAGCPTGDRCWVLELLNGFPPTKALAELHDPFIDWSSRAFAQGGSGWFKAVTIPPFAVPGCASSGPCVTAGLVIATDGEVSGARTLAPPTCAASLSPASGTTATSFSSTWSSDATSCRWKLDGVDQGAVACTGSTGGLKFAAGSHRISLVATGPGGTRTCDSAAVSVMAPLPTCTISLGPSSGTTETSFSTTWSSNGTSCRWKKDGVDQGAVACAGSASGALFPTTGSHRLSLVATSPGGTKTCDSATVSVTAPLPTCTISVSPSSGRTTTSFGVSWSSNGTSCRWKKDGVDQGAVACAGSASGALFPTTGSHRLSLVATGPGGTKSCDSNTVSVSP